MYIFFGTQHLQLVRDLVRKHGFHCADVPCVWHKTGGGGQGGGDVAYAPNYESFFLCHKGRRKLNKPGTSNVFVHPRLSPHKKVHPTEKPTSLIRDLVEQSSDPGELVVDPFAGSSSTLVGAFECKRRAWGCEKDKEYHSQGVLKIEEFKKKEGEEE